MLVGSLLACFRYARRFPPRVWRVCSSVPSSLTAGMLVGSLLACGGYARRFPPRYGQGQGQGQGQQGQGQGQGQE